MNCINKLRAMQYLFLGREIAIVIEPDHACLAMLIMPNQIMRKRNT